MLVIQYANELRMLGGVFFKLFGRPVPGTAVNKKPFHLFLRKILLKKRIDAAVDVFFLVQYGDDDGHETVYAHEALLPIRPVTVSYINRTSFLNDRLFMYSMLSLRL